MAYKREKPVSEYKKKEVARLTDLAKTKKTILIASIKNLPASQFQDIVKKLRGTASVKVPKKRIILRALDNLEESGKEVIEKLENQIKADVAILFSDIDGYELAGKLLKYKSPVKAKTGQIAPSDIEVQEGPTELMPGPAVSELGVLGIQIKIDKGKINIAAPKVIVKEGEKISENAADVMSKLDIKPFSVGLIPLAVFDTETKTLYTDIKIDTEQATDELKHAYSRALPFAVEIGYPTKETITFMIGKAAMYGKALESLTEKEESSEDSKEKESADSEGGNKEENKSEEEKSTEESETSKENQTPETKTEPSSEEK